MFSLRNDSSPVGRFAIGFLASVILAAAAGKPDMVGATVRRAAALCFGAGGGGQAQPRGALASYAVGAGKATFGLALPAGLARHGVQVGSNPTQTDVKTAWPDGSIRFAVVTAEVARGGRFAITASDASAGTFVPRWPTVSVDFTIQGQVFSAALPLRTADDSWLSGPLVQESRVVVAPAAAGRLHPLLRVVFDVRSYSTGGHRVDVAVQNISDVPGGVAVSYDVAIVIDGVSAFQRSSVRQSYLTRWRKTFAVGGLVEAEVVPDFEPLFASGMVPRFLASVKNDTDWNPAGDRWDILGRGAIYDDMSSPGGRADLAPLPNWTAQYLVHRHAKQRAMMMAMADLSGSWSGHIANPDGTLITLEERPNYWLDGRGTQWGGDGPKAANSQAGTMPGVTNGIDTPHAPTLNYVPYLLTGDRWHLDQLTQWANYAMLNTWPGDENARRTGVGLLIHLQVRGMAWGLRLMAEAAAALPDVDPVKAYMTSRVQANLDWLDVYARTNDSGPLGPMLYEKNIESGVAQVALWQIAYLAWSLDHARQLGFGPTDAFRRRASQFQVALFNGGAEYPVEYAPAPWLKVAVNTGGNALRGTYAVDRTVGEIFQRTFGAAPQPASQWEGYYGVEARLLLAMGARDGVPGAANALAVLMRPGMKADVNDRSGFAIDFSRD